MGRLESGAWLFVPGRVSPSTPAFLPPSSEGALDICMIISRIPGLSVIFDNMDWSMVESGGSSQLGRIS